MTGRATTDAGAATAAGVWELDRAAGRNSDPPLERRANVFGAELLMPTESVRDVFQEADSIDMTATSFGVYPPAMHWRLYNAGLVGEPPG